LSEASIGTVWALAGGGGGLTTHIFVDRAGSVCQQWVRQATDGKYQQERKTFVMQEGDIVVFMHNVTAPKKK
jgi:hypothetical protein